MAEPASFAQNLPLRHALSAAFRGLIIVATFSGLAVLAILLIDIFTDGVPWVDTDFLTKPPSMLFPEKAGIAPAIWGSLWVVGLTAFITIPIGVSAAVYMEEYARPSPLRTIIEINIANLAGVPSIVYGILGLAMFVRFLDLKTSVLSGALTLSLLVLPIVIIASREALRAVPQSIRQAAFGVGATRWQTIRDHVLPAALPGIATGTILAVSRAMGETAPLIMVGAFAFVSYSPSGIGDKFTVLPLQIWGWSADPRPIFRSLASGAIVVLLVVLLLMNATAVFIRHRFQRHQEW